ncbi:hypothetical protein HRI_002743500 [Hibiscus trionum]|uniref:Uncharacterized protein n=1 Tax=Hibiscus trionum TaxID=183268 RepID=A0A9W7I8H9_HIBTR|nr:hypothetical protein HRI_002743500 [Hibiscus trionum]
MAACNKKQLGSWVCVLVFLRASSVDNGIYDLIVIKSMYLDLHAKGIAFITRIFSPVSSVSISMVCVLQSSIKMEVHVSRHFRFMLTCLTDGDFSPLNSLGYCLISSTISYVLWYINFD